ncbi:MAG: type I restriction endonuclease subunit R [Phycisphaerae bacterium]|nr:type I restriction endonuclease subunit R [Phycisphaerae bacterium]
MITGINNEDRLVQKTVADHLRQAHGWDSVYAWNEETFGPDGTFGRASERDVVLPHELQYALRSLNVGLPEAALQDAYQKLTRYDAARSLLQHNREFYKYMREGVPVTYRDADGVLHRDEKVKVIDFRKPLNNRFTCVRELKIQGLRSPHYNRRADLVCFVNGLPVVFIELKAVYVNIRAGFDNNLSDYRDTIPHAFHHNGLLIVSNGDRAKYGSITSKWEHFFDWKRNDEKDSGNLEAETLLDGMLAKDKLLDLFENFILFDDGRAGGTRKIVARNQQVLGVNNAVQAVRKQQELKARYPIDERLIRFTVSKAELRAAAEGEEKERLASRDEGLRIAKAQPTEIIESDDDTLPLVKRAHPDLGRIGVFWHTQGSGKSYSMAFFTEKVRRTIHGNHTFVLMTDRDDLDDQIHRTFVGCGIADEKTPRASSGKHLEELLKADHRFIFTLIQKFKREEPPKEPYSLRDDIIVISDEAHRTQAGKLARNMRLALPNAAFIGFTGTPIFKNDHITRRIFGSYISRYDFCRSEQDGSTVRLVYENRGEKLGITRLDLNDRIAEKIEQADLDTDQVALLEKLLGKDYEVVTADDRLDKVADDFVEHCAARWQSGKVMLVCIDKVTCGRMHERIIPRWKAKLEAVRRQLDEARSAFEVSKDSDERERLGKRAQYLGGQVAWMETTLIHIIVSESQNEVRDFRRWGIDVRPHRALIKKGFELDGGKTVSVEDAFKDPGHPFRVAIVCAMWLTGFDVECLSTLYIDKPMKAHTLMQAIARANRVYPGKSCGVIVDYNGVLKSLREALAEYAVGGEDEGGGGGEGREGGGQDVVEPLAVMIAALEEAIKAAEDHLRGLGFEPSKLIGAKGFDRIRALRDATNALYTSDEVKCRFEVIAREVFARMKAVIAEPAAFAYAERHDNIEAVYKKLQERRDTADVTELLKELHRIVNEAIRTQGAGEDHAEALTVDLSQIDFEGLREEFANKVSHKALALKDIRDIVEEKLEQMLARNPTTMDYYKRYQEIIADYNREKDRATVEDTFAQLVKLASDLDAEQRRAAEEGLSQDELALFDMLYRDDITKKDRERLKQASRDLLASLREILEPMQNWTEKEATRAEVQVHILDRLFSLLPRPPFTDADAQLAAERLFDYVWQRSAAGNLFAGVAA